VSIRMEGVKATVGGFMSVDGRVAPADRIGRKFSRSMTPRHRKMLRWIRSRVDAVIVGVRPRRISGLGDIDLLIDPT
jgi:hypothetical protein